MSGSPVLFPVAIPHGDPPSRPGRRFRLRRRPNAFEWIQLLLVLWMAASEVLRGGIGVTLLPELPGAARGVALPAGVAVMRMATAALYPLLAFVGSRRFPLWNRPRRHVACALAALACAHAVAALCGVVQVRLGFNGPGWPFYLHKTLAFVVFTLFAHGLIYGERRHEKEREELRLRAEMAGSAADRMRAQVRALRMEWSPRFLTGTLESIGELLARDVGGAKRLLLGLSAVLRRTLAHARIETVRLEQEVEFVREVLRVEALRRPGLMVEWAIDEEALELPVPHMALLTTVYGVLPGGDAAGPVRVRISAAAEEAAVALRVEAHGGAVRTPAGTDGQEGGGERPGTVFGTGHGLRRSAIAPDGLRLELRCAAEPQARQGGGAPVRPVVRGVPRPAESASAPAPAGDEQPAVGRRLELGTYSALLLFYTLVSVYTALGDVWAQRFPLAAPAWVYVAGSGLYAALWWGSLVVTARFLSARYPVRQENWPRRLLVHLGGAVLVSVANAVLLYPFQFYVVGGGGIHIGVRGYWEWGDLTVYPPLAGVAHGFIYAREYYAKRLSELRLRSQLSESELRRTRAELQALKAELDPHFLFNALNTVSSLMHTRVDEARRVVAHLSALLRRVLESGGLNEVTVEEEAEFIRLYMEIEQARFGDALRMVYRVDPDTRGARVPHLLVQPLVENAVKHGLRPRGGTGRVVLSTRRDGPWLELTVADDGAGPGEASGAEGTGTGLANVRERLRQLHGDQQSFALEPAPGGGAVARIRIPFSEQPRPVAAGEAALELEAV